MSLLLRQRIVMLTPAAPAGYSVVYALTNVTSSNTDTTVAIGGSYTTTLTAAIDYNISSVTVTMGGIDITATAYSNGVVTIAEVTGAIVITATGVSIWATWVTIRTRVYNSSTTKNIVYAASDIDRMILEDGTEVTPVTFYDFGDNAYHTVRLYLKDMQTFKGKNYVLFNQVSNYCIRYVFIPASFTTFPQNALRYLGSSQTVDVIIDNTTPPNMTGSNTTGTSSIKIYVPDASVDLYKAASYWSGLSSKIYPLSNYTGTIY